MLSKVLIRCFISTSIFILCVSGLRFAPGVITQFNFNEGTGTTVSDLSGNAHNGTLVNGPLWTAGEYGQAISLDGVNDYVNIPDHPDFTLNPAQSYSWSGWVKNNNFNDWGTVWSQTADANNFFYFYAHTSNDAEAGPVTNGISVYWNNGTNKLIIHSNSNVLTAGVWSYVAVTYDASQAQSTRFTIYVNGADVTDRSDVVSSGTITAIDPVNIRIGSDEPFNEYLNGSVDEVRYYRRLISVAEIQADMNMSDTQAPAVTITAPATGNVAGTINITANATDNVGVVGVQFLLDGVNLGAEDIVSPYSVSWNTLPTANGSHNLTAVARDAAGNTITSSVIVVNVNNDTQSPVVTITAPAAGNVSGTINITANASDNVGVVGVQFLLDGVNLGAEDITSPYSVSWNTLTTTSGSHNLTAKARDAAGNITTSSAVVVNVNNDTQAPVVTITAPATGNVSGTINVTANASDDVSVVGVQFLLDGNNLGVEDNTSPYSVSWNTLTATTGSHNLTAVARDAAGNTTTSSTLVVNVNNDTQSPVVIITAPAAGNVAGTINVTANGTDNVGVVGVQFLLDGVNLGAEDITSPYSVSWNTLTSANGSHNLTAVARDAAGNTTTSINVIVNVSNIPDTQIPTVSITAPLPGNVSGIVNVTANANDDVGVAGVQFLLDGNNMGTEDISLPYSISWNASTATVGNHILTAKARDAAGNIAVSAALTITVFSSAPVISGISTGPVTTSSVVIVWTTDVPANSQINYGTTTAYGLSTLADATLTTSHSQILDGLTPGTLYHYQVLSSNGIPATSTDNTFTTASLSPTLGILNGHTVLAYPAGKIIPWTPNPTYGYDSVMKLAWNYLLNTVPNDPLTGKPAYYSRSYINPNTQQMVDWPHNPAGLYSMLVESAIKYYGYSGNANVMQLAVNVALWHLDHGMTTATDSWASVPYSEGASGSVNYGGAPQDGVGNLEPDKIGELGHAWLQLYKYNGNTRFRDAAIQAANVLSSKVRVGAINQSPWPFRVNAHDGTVLENYCANVIGPVALLDDLIALGLGNTAAYQAARTTAWNWMMAFPMQNNIWSQYFEDVPIQQNYATNLNQYNANMVARYLLEHPEMDTNWQTHVRGIITWVENIFGQTQYGSTIIKEQLAFAYAMGSHTSRYASVNAMLYEKTGDTIAKEKAYRSFNWASYMARSNGVVIDGLLYGSEDNANQWFSDGYGDYIRHFMTGVAAVPEWSPANQTHLLRSSSVVKNISYGTNSVDYTTYGASGVEVLHVNFNPVTVTVDGMALQKRSDLSQPGWTLDVATKTLRIYHTNIYHTATTQISINSGTAVTPPASVNYICPGSSSYLIMPSPGSDYLFQWQIDSTGTGFVDLLNDAVHSGVNTEILSLNAPPASYFGFKYRCIAYKSDTSVFGIQYVLKYLVMWRGIVSTAWENSSNWTCNYIPDASTDVIIPGGTLYKPVISNDAVAHKITIALGSLLTVSPGIKLDITGK